jgi:hypothetical protein
MPHGIGPSSGLERPQGACLREAAAVAQEAILSVTAEASPGRQKNETSLLTGPRGTYYISAINDGVAATKKRR